MKAGAPPLKPKPRLVKKAQAGKLLLATLGDDPLTLIGATIGNDPLHQGGADATVTVRRRYIEFGDFSRAARTDSGIETSAGVVQPNDCHADDAVIDQCRRHAVITILCCRCSAGISATGCPLAPCVAGLARTTTKVSECGSYKTAPLQPLWRRRASSDRVGVNR